MADRIATDEIARLRSIVAVDPGAPEFAALTEALRREERLEEAVAVAEAGIAADPRSVEGPLVLALALVDQGRIAEARASLASRADELVAHLAAPDFAVDLSLGEIEEAFERAEPVADEMMNADHVAQSAILAAELDAPESVPVESDRLFATRTMADLLESQGERDSAERIRAALDQDAAAPPPTEQGAETQRERIIQTLEGWLATLGRETR